MLGAVAGIVGNIPKTILSITFYYFGWIRYSFNQLAAGIFMKQKFLSNPLALVIGYITDFTVAAFIGIMLVYIVRKTGNNYEIFKGILAGMASYVILYGVMLRLDITTGNIETSLPNFLALLLHIIFGMLSGWIVKHYSLVSNE